MKVNNQIYSYQQANEAIDCKSKISEPSCSNIEQNLRGMIEQFITQSIRKSLVEAIMSQVTQKLQGLFSGQQPPMCNEPSQIPAAPSPMPTPSVPESTTPAVAAEPKLEIDALPSESAPGTTVSLNDFITGGRNGQVNEERLQHGIVRYLLAKESPSLEQAYLSAFKEAKSSGLGTEDAVKAGLKSLVQDGLLPREKAREINGTSFRAAQLDSNLKALYDGKGGEGDNTVAKKPVAEAIALAEKALLAIQNGEMKAKPRSLSAASNGTESTGASATTRAGSQEFLWKPQSEGDGKLVVLLPARFAGEVESAGIYSSLPPSERNLIEKGRYTGDNANQNRLHFRFGKEGGSYPDGAYLVAKLSSGKTVSYQIGETSSRFTQ